MKAYLIEHWGSDEEIIRAARMSTNKGFQGWDKDFRLLKYLYINKHMTPFEMAGIHVEIECPIFVARQIVRHRTFSFNELSARYVKMPDKSWVPDAHRLCAQDTANKQAQSENKLEDKSASRLVKMIARHNEKAQELYKKLLDCGVPREVARTVLPLGRYTKFRMSGNLRNWLHFLTLRTDSHTQLETQTIAEMIGFFVQMKFPRTHSLWCTVP